MDRSPRPKGIGRQQPKTRTRRSGRRSTIMLVITFLAGVGAYCGRGRATQPVRERPSTQLLDEVGALPKPPACR